MVGWHHRLNGHEFEHAPGVGDGQGRLACCRPWGHKELDMTEQLNSNNNFTKFLLFYSSFYFWIYVWIFQLCRHIFLPPIFSVYN